MTDKVQLLIHSLMKTTAKSNPASTSGFHAVVVGGGLGGMAAAARLARNGARVTLIERNRLMGGKVAEHRAAGFRWDIGPSLLTMPDVVEELEKALHFRAPKLHRLDAVCRYFWPDGHRLDADEAFCRGPEVAAFMEYARGIYQLSGEAFLRHPPSEFWRPLADPRQWRHLAHLPKVATFRTLSEEVRSRFSDPHLIQLFERFATYNGSSPYRTPATFNVIPYVENAFGAWYPEGGIRALARWLTNALDYLGVEVHTDTVVTLYDGTTVQTNTGLNLKPDVVICNGEVPGAYERWIRHSGFRDVQEKVEPEEWSLSGFVLLLGVNRKYPHLRHHNIFFSEDYPEEFRTLFEERDLPEDPTVYINISACTTPEDAPAAHDNYFVLVNAPAEVREINWSLRAPAYQRLILAKLEDMGLTNLSQHIVYSKIFTPADFARRDLSTGGALYGAASHGIRASLFRPPIVSPHDPKLFFVGGSTHPGGGIPLVLLSARMASEAVLRKFGKF